MVLEYIFADFVQGEDVVYDEGEEDEEGEEGE